MSGKLENIFYAQSLFQGKVEGKLPHDDPNKFHYHITSMVEELGEVLKADKRWKTHRNTTYVKQEKLDELADVFITAINLSLWSGIGPEQMFDAIENKIVENNKRIDGSKSYAKSYWS